MNTDPRSNDELNRIIAEWCGWKQGHSVHWRRGMTRKYDWGWTPPKALAFTSTRYTPGKTSCVPPNYCGSLDALNDVVVRLSPNALFAYAGEIGKLTEDGVCWTTRTLAVSEATARQRAEAIVKVIEEGKR